MISRHQEEEALRLSAAALLSTSGHALHSQVLAALRGVFAREGTLDPTIMDLAEKTATSAHSVRLRYTTSNRKRLRRW